MRRGGDAPADAGLVMHAVLHVECRQIEAALQHPLQQFGLR